MSRISPALEDEIRRYTKSRVQGNPAKPWLVQKYTTFNTIYQLSSDGNRLTLDELLHILQELTMDQTKFLFASASGPDVETKAAKLIFRLFAELGCPITKTGLEKIVKGDLAKDRENEAVSFERWKKQIKETITYSWKILPDKTRRKHFWHEVKSGMRKISKLFSGLSNNDSRTPAEILYDTYRDFSFKNKSQQCDYKSVNQFGKTLLDFQEKYPDCMPELLGQLSRQYCNTIDAQFKNNFYAGYCRAILEMSKQIRQNKMKMKMK